MKAQFPRSLIQLMVFLTASSIAVAQIYVADASNKRVGVYSLNGQPINPSLITGFNDPNADGPADVAIAGTNLYVLSTIFTNSDGIGTIGKYNLDGSVVNASLITNITGYPESIVISDTNIFVSSINSGVIGKYTTSGGTVNASLITGLDAPAQMAVSGTNLFIADFQGKVIRKYSTAGLVLSSVLITNLGQVNGIAISGTNLFVAETSKGRIGKYSTSGTTINTNLVSGIVSARILAISGTNLFVTDDFASKVRSYSFSGVANSTDLISGLSHPYGIAIAPTFQSITRSNSGVILTWNAVEGQNYQLQYKTNLTQPAWSNLFGPITAPAPTASVSNQIAEPQRFYRVLYLP